MPPLDRNARLKRAAEASTREAELAVGRAVVSESETNTVSSLLEKAAFLYAESSREKESMQIKIADATEIALKWIDRCKLIADDRHDAFCHKEAVALRAFYADNRDKAAREAKERQDQVVRDLRMSSCSITMRMEDHNRKVVDYTERLAGLKIISTEARKIALRTQETAKGFAAELAFQSESARDRRVDILYASGIYL